MLPFKVKWLIFLLRLSENAHLPLDSLVANRNVSVASRHGRSALLSWMREWLQQRRLRYEKENVTDNGRGPSCDTHGRLDSRGR